MKQTLRTTAVLVVIALAGFLNLSSAFASIRIDISPRSLNFGVINVGTSAERTITITNESTSTATGDLHMTPPKDLIDWEVVGGWDPFSLLPGQSQTVTVRFSPQATGPYVDTLIITDNGDGIASPNPCRIDLSGNGCNCNGSDTNLVVNVTNGLNTTRIIDFGTIPVGQVVNAGFLITDASSPNTTRQLNGAVSTSNVPFIITSGQGGFTLSSGNSRSVSINFAPTQSGSFFDSIVVTSNADDPASRRITIFLTGQATQHSSGDTTLTFSFNGTIPTNGDLDFGKVLVGTKASLNFTILDASSIATLRQLFGLVGGAHVPFTVTSGQGTFTLNSGGSITVTITFMPGSAGTFQDSILIISNADDPAFRSLTLHLHGIGITNGPPTDSTSALAISGLTQVLNFGYVAINDVGLRYFTISNVSSANITISGNVTPITSPFKVETGVGAFNLTKGAVQTVFVSFKPTKLGAFYDSIIVTSNAANAPRTIVYVVGTSANTSSVEASMPIRSALSVYPNPFSSTNTIAFSTAHAAHVSLRVYDLLGAEVAAITDATLPAGPHQFEWNPTNLRNGTYFYRLQVGSETKTARVILSR